MDDVFEQIYRDYARRIYLFLFRLCRSESEAEELTQETFFRAFKNFDRFRGDSSVGTWLMSIAKNTYISYARKNKRRAETVEIDSAMDALARGQDGVEETVAQQQLYASVRRLVKELPAKYHDVVVLRLYSEKSFKQIAETLHISENAAKVMYCRAKKMLKERMSCEYQL